MRIAELYCRARADCLKSTGDVKEQISECEKDFAQVQLPSDFLDNMAKIISKPEWMGGAAFPESLFKAKSKELEVQLRKLEDDPKRKAVYCLGEAIKHALTTPPNTWDGVAIFAVYISYKGMRGTL